MLKRLLNLLTILLIVFVTSSSMWAQSATPSNILNLYSCHRDPVSNLPVQDVSPTATQTVTPDRDMNLLLRFKLFETLNPGTFDFGIIRPTQTAEIVLANDVPHPELKVGPQELRVNLQSTSTYVPNFSLHTFFLEFTRVGRPPLLLCAQNVLPRDWIFGTFIGNGISQDSRSGNESDTNASTAQGLASDPAIPSQDELNADGGCGRLAHTNRTSSHQGLLLTLAMTLLAVLRFRSRPTRR